MIRRWTLVAYPITGSDPDFTALSKALAEAANADPGVFWTRRGARSAARFHASMLPIAMEVVRRQPTTYPCACGCGRRFTANAGWDGYHGPAL